MCREKDLFPTNEIHDLFIAAAISVITQENKITTK